MSKCTIEYTVHLLISMQPSPKKLLDQVRDAFRLKHYAYRTEETYIQWIRCYILFHNKRHPKEMGNAEIEAFLTYLAVEGQVFASTQNQALSALLFLCREMLDLEMTGINAVRAKQPQYVPMVLINFGKACQLIFTFCLYLGSTPTVAVCSGGISGIVLLSFVRFDKVRHIGSHD